jgi:hypothetical protein
MRQFLASILAAAGLGLAALMAIAAIGPSVAAASEGRPPVYAAQCWLTLEDRGTDAVLVAHAAQGLSGSWELTVDGEALGGVFEGDGRNPSLLHLFNAEVDFEDGWDGHDSSSSHDTRIQDWVPYMKWTELVRMTIVHYLLCFPALLPGVLKRAIGPILIHESIS